MLVLPPISTEGMTAAEVGKLADDVRDKMLRTLQEISSPSPEAASRGAAARSQEGEDAPLLQGSQEARYSADESAGVRRRSPSSKSATSEDLAQTGALDGKALVGDVGESVKRAAAVGEETEDEETEDGVIVNKP